MKKQNIILQLAIIAILTTPHTVNADWWSALNSVFFPTQQQSTTTTLNKTEAYNYINQIFSSMENALYAHMVRADLYSLKQLVIANINQAEYIYPGYNASITTEKRYSKDMIDQLLSSAILEYIQKTSYDYTYSRTHDKAIATRIAESMRNNALAIIAQNSTIDFKKLVPFVGQALERAVNDLLRNNNQYQTTNHSYTPAKPSTPSHQQYSYIPQKPSAPPYQEQSQYTPAKPSVSQYHKPSSDTPKPNVKPTPKPISPQQLFTSGECAVCLEEFSEKGGNVERVILYPCGHDICKTCAFDWFFGVTQKTECPQCRASVNLHQLQNDII